MANSLSPVGLDPKSDEAQSIMQSFINWVAKNYRGTEND